MTFDQILSALKSGIKSRRKAWVSTHYIYFVIRKNKLPGLVAQEGNFSYPYKISNLDLFADDWELMK